MAFPPEFLDRLRHLLPLSDVIGRSVRLTRRGREHSGLCPFHSEKSPSFTVSDDKGFYHCFGCGAHGDVVGFVMQTEGLSFPEAVEKLANEAGLPVPESGPRDRERETRRADLHEVLEAACVWFEEQLLAGREGRAARDYLEQRGLTAETCRSFRLGYAPNRRGALRQALNARGIGDGQLVAAGLVKQPEGGGETRDYFFDRVIFPIADRRGRIIAFGGRAMGDSPAKYLNSPDTELFHKGRVLYNLDRARKAVREAGDVIVCEGYMDVIALAQAGFPAAVAPLGTAITEDQIQELWRLDGEPVVCLDGDTAGQRAAYKLVERALPLLRPGFSLRFALLPQGEDPDSLVKGQGARAFRFLVDSSRPLSDVLWMKETEARNFDTPERRAGLRQTLHKTVAQIADPSVQEAYRTEMEQRFRQSFGFRRGDRNGSDWNGRGGKKRGGGLRDGSQSRPGAVSLGSGAGVGGGLGAHRSPSFLRRRSEQVLLATLVNHPSLLYETAEEMAGIELVSRDLDGLRGALIDLAAQRQDLDTVEIRRHLRQVFGNSVEAALLDQDQVQLWPFAQASATVQEAREGLRHLIDLYRQRAAAQDSVEEHRRFAQTMDETSLSRLKAKQEAAQSGANGRIDFDWADGSDTSRGST